MRYKTDSRRSRGDSSRLARQTLGIMVTVVTLACLALLLTACKTVPEVRTVRIEPPEAYLQPCPVPAPEGDTMGYVIEQYVPALQQALHGCNADKKRLREWGQE